MKDWLLNQICTHGVIHSTVVFLVAVLTAYGATVAAINVTSRRQAARIRAVADEQPGTDRELLRTCHQIAAQPLAVRKENPQP
ncbi:hypothetical protein [Streptomyces spiralis]